MRQKRKRDIATGILVHTPTTALVPDRLSDLYYSALESFGYADLPPDLQGVAILGAWYQCKIFDVLDRRYLYGERSDLAESGTPVTTHADRREKQTELEQLPKLQKGLLECVGVLRAARKGETDETSELAEALRTYSKAVDDASN